MICPKCNTNKMMRTKDENNAIVYVCVKCGEYIEETDVLGNVWIRRK